jgi:hypothetical protein
MPRYRLPSDPGASGAPVVPSDTVPLKNCSRGLYVGTGGDLVVVLTDTTEVLTFKNVPSGAVLPIQVRYVKVATDAEDIIALW